MKSKLLCLILLASTTVDAQQQSAKWRSQPEVLNNNQQLFENKSSINLDQLKQRYNAEKKPVVLFLKGRELTNEISDWGSNRRFKVTQNIRAEGTDTEGKDADLRLDNEVHAEVETKQLGGQTDSGFVTATLYSLLEGMNDAFKEIRLRQVSYATVLKKQQRLNEQQKDTRREADVTKIEFDAISNQIDWLMTSSYTQEGFQFQVIDSKTGVILADHSVPDSQVQGHQMVASDDGYQAVAIPADHRSLGYETALILVDAALNDR